MPASRRTPCDDAGGALDDGQDRRVDRGRDGPGLEAVGAGQLVAGAHRQAALARARGDEPLVLGRVDGERAADGERRAARSLHPVEDGVDTLGVEAAGRVEEGVLGVQHAAGGELEVADAGALAGQPQLGLGADADDPDARDVALEQRVHRLRRRVGDELDAVAVLAELVEQRPQRLRDALGDPAGGGVARRHDGVRAHAQRLQGERDRLREGAADVDADADAGRHAAAALTPSPSPPRGAVAAPAATRTRRGRRGRRSRARRPG